MESPVIVTPIMLMVTVLASISVNGIKILWGGSHAELSFSLTCVAHGTELENHCIIQYSRCSCKPLKLKAVYPAHAPPIRVCQLFISAVLSQGNSRSSPTVHEYCY